MSSSDKPGVGVPEPPPSPMVMMSGITVALQLATVLALLFDRCGVATILAILSLIFGGILFLMLLRSSGSSDKPGVGAHEPPPGG